MVGIFPYIEVSGSYEDVGNAIGKRMSHIIKEAIGKRQLEVPNYSNYLQEAEKYYQITNQHFPQLIVECDAIALAAGVNKMDYFLANCREIYDGSEEDEPVPPDHCTIAVSFGLNGAVVGHNEDWSIDALNSLYILKATVGETTFLSLNYALAIPGPAAAMNNWGLVQCINELYQTNQFGVPKNFLARAVLECKSLVQAEGLLTSIPRASGYNHVLVQDHQVFNVEMAGTEIAVDKIQGDSYVHTNHYLSAIKHLEKFHTQSSEARYQQARELITANMTLPAMQALLSDTSNPRYPICRSDATIASLVFQPEAKTILICKGHPCAGSYQEYKL